MAVNALYTNLVNAPSSIFLADGTTVAPWMTGLNATAGALLVRDMGKTVFIPAPEAGSYIGSQSTILRKVQLVTGYYGTGSGTGGTPGSVSEFYTGYIRIGGQTYGGGAPVAPTAFVRAN